MKIKSIKEVYLRRVYAIQTSTETFISDGLAHHNCYQCNINLSGNWLEYRKNMIETYGLEETERIEQLKWTGNVKYSVVDYADKIEEYAEKVRKLEENYKKEE